MARKKVNISQRQKIFGTIVATISGTLLLTVGFLIVSLGSYFRNHAAYQIYHQQLQNNATESVPFINALYRPFLFEESIQQIHPALVSSFLADRETVILTNAVLELLHERKWVDAYSTYYNTVEKQLSDVARTRPSHPKFALHVEGLEKGFEEFRNTVRVFNEEYAGAPDRIAVLERKLKEQFVLMVDLVQKTANFFDLYAVQYSSENLDAVRFYDSGILKGLPLLQGLPDGIETLDELKTKLHDAGGSVSISGDNVALLFQEELQELKESSHIFSSNVSEFQKERSNLKEKHQEYLDKIDKESLVLVTQLKELLSSMTKPLSAVEAAEILSGNIPSSVLTPLSSFIDRQINNFSK